jgi:hypothetical protein
MLEDAIRLPGMISFRNLAETRTPDGARFSLHEHDGEYFLKLNGRQLMGSNSTVSELLLADLACKFRYPVDRPCILIGGLGLGFSLRRVLEIAGPNAFAQVSELLPEVVAWNREFLQDLNGKLLDDRHETSSIALKTDQGVTMPFSWMSIMAPLHLFRQKTRASTTAKALP